MKQETLEEVAERLFKKYSNNTSLSEGHYDYMMDKEDFKEASLEIAKWQQEQSKNKYSEEEVEQLVIHMINQIEVRIQKIISNSELMTSGMWEGGCMAFESSQDVIKESFNQFKKK
jgi:hypothetical protein